MPQTNNIIKDISTLTKVPVKIWKQLLEKLRLCISSTVYDAMLANEDTAIIEIPELGILSINIVSQQIKFLPSKAMRADLKNCIVHKVDPLELSLDSEVVNKLMSIYKDTL